LKRLALLWAQAHGYSACAFEVSLPKSGYRADLAAYRHAVNKTMLRTSLVPDAAPDGKSRSSAGTAATAGQMITRIEIGTTAIFECKRALVDLRRDNCSTAITLERLLKADHRRQVLERNLRVHYPQLRIADSLFSEFESHDFAAINHKGYLRVLRELTALQNRLYDCTKFEKLIRYRCANLFFLVLPGQLYREPEIPISWGALVESGGALALMRKPVWQQSPSESRLRLLRRIAAAGTRTLNRQFKISMDDVIVAHSRSC
jgi:hypothetical protein